MNTFIKLPIYAKASLIFIGLFALISMLFLAQRIIVPVIYATIIAIVLSPLVKFFIKIKINKIIAITITLVLAIGLTFSIVAFLCSQAGKLSSALPVLEDKFHFLLDQTAAWISDSFNISPDKTNLWIADMKSEIADSSGSAIGKTLLYTGSVLIVLVLIPVYVFMILYYQPLLLEFVHKLFRSKRHGELNEVLTAIKRIIQSYLIGILLEVFIIAALNSTSLLLIGIDYPVLLGVVGAILNIIPYIGGVLGVSLPFLLALATKPSLSYAFFVLIAYMVIQFIDNHYIVPKVVASKVKINALVSIVVVLAGSALWGIPGMLISIPLTAIIKVICDHIEPLKPWGFLLGDTFQGMARSKNDLKRKLLKKPELNAN